MRRLFVTGLMLVALLLAGCRGTQSDNPPFHMNLDMDFQPKFGPQEANPYFEDGAAMRAPVSGTVPRGELRDSSALYQGRTADGDYVDQIPIAVNREVLERGRERYEIQCSVCHGKTGDGNGVIMRGDYGYTPAPSYHVGRLRESPDGYLYDVIANGVRSMPAYGKKVSVMDRWAIVAYIRALQRSQNATPDDLPPGERAELGAAPEGGATAQAGTE
ncbi:mono/diheme cytochrome c family protein [Salinibacter ruber]|uniref:c-type cytochrome n=1 Tax=Salinibacter ruber TaxID=146919 RepID=UPI0021688D4A|nr:cytochrome c [Salinibacter ruber]MCS3673186.1 mono/diheme cytochrome c family protein [Salinibacter ruber]